MGHPQVTKIYNEEKVYSIRSLVVVHILNFKRDIDVMRFICIELIICSTSKVDRVKVHIHVIRDVLGFFTSHEVYTRSNKNSLA